jgi:hypothetical protein
LSLHISDFKLEEWKSSQNHVERHFFIPGNEIGYQSSRYVWGYNPQLISESQVDRIMAILDEG